MTHIERELAEHLRHLSITIGPRPLGSPAHAAAVRYVGAAFADWGFAVEILPAPGFGELGAPRIARPSEAAAERCAERGAVWRVIGRLGLGPPARVQLRARLDSRPSPGGDPGAASLAVLLALGRFLAQHQLRHGLEVVAFSGDGDPDSLALGPPLAGADGAGQIIASLSFDGPGQTFAPNLVGGCGVSAAVASGVRLLLARYPEVGWAGAQPQSEGAGRDTPGLWIGGSGRAGRPITHSTGRLREAAMLGAEIVALLQTQTAASCRPAGQTIRSAGGRQEPEAGTALASCSAGTDYKAA